MTPRDLKIVTVDRDKNGILKRDLREVQTQPDAIRRFRLAMIALCRKKGGVGLAANQAGLAENFFVALPGAKILPNSKIPEFCLNPTWEPAPESELYEHKEGCLSLPGRRFVVNRHTLILATWTDLDGKPHERQLKGYAAAVFQHESDHLRGLTLLDTGKEVRK